MELRQLEYVVAVAEELHFGRAAERVHVRQQSVSEQVARLERELGGPLFTRTSRRVALTAAGEAFLPEARAVLAAATRALATGRQAVAGARELRVGYAEDLGTELFTRAPGVRVVPVPLTTPEQLAAIAERRLDAGWCWEPDVPPDLDSELVGREAALLVLRANDPAATDPVDPGALGGRALAVVPRSVNPWLHDRFVDGLHARGADVVVAHEAVRLDRLVPLVLSGVAIGITQERVLAGGLPPGLVARSLPGEPLVVEHRLVWRRDAGRPPL